MAEKAKTVSEFPGELELARRVEPRRLRAGVRVRRLEDLPREAPRALLRDAAREIAASGS